MIGLERGKVMLAFDNNGYWKLAFEEERKDWDCCWDNISLIFSILEVQL